LPSPRALHASAYARATSITPSLDGLRRVRGPCVKSLNSSEQACGREQQRRSPGERRQGGQAPSIVMPTLRERIVSIRTPPRRWERYPPNGRMQEPATTQRVAKLPAWIFVISYWLRKKTFRKLVSPAKPPDVTA
jgi:hypothetical protein